jgi:hypothetical protein
MPKNSPSSARTRAARQLAAAQGIKYTEALRLVSQAPKADPPIPPAALAAAAADPAAGYAADDWSTAARMARDDAGQLRAWEARRAGRPVRMWEAGIEVRCAATCELEAWWRLTLYMREPRYRAAGLASEPMSQDLDGRARGTHSQVQLVPDGQVSLAERERLELDYPRRDVLWPREWTLAGPEKDHDITEYACALRLASWRLSGELDAPPGSSRPPLPGGVTLRIWRAVYKCRFLAGMSTGDARGRAAELAGTVVAWDGRPSGRVLSLEPDDGFAGASGWLHPACTGTIGRETQDALWDDYDAGASAAVQAAALTREAGLLEGHWHRSNAEAEAWEARLHTQPDGSRTLSTARELEDIAMAARVRHGYKTPAQLREAADQASYMAERVYGKAVENDDDYRRIERARHQATVLRQLADDLEARKPGSGPPQRMLTDEDRAARDAYVYENSGAWPEPDQTEE